MAEKDIAERKLLSHNSVFADVANGILFDGKKVIRPEDLTDLSPRSAYYHDGDSSLHDQERDVFKYCESIDIALMIIGVENQSASYVDMVPKCLGYDGVSYKSQEQERERVRRFNAHLKKGEQRQAIPVLTPIVTIVIYYGLKPWNAPTTLYGALGLNSDSKKAFLKKYISDYKLNIVSLARKNISEKFSGDFGFVANEVYNLRHKTECVYRGTADYVDDTVDTLVALSGDSSNKDIRSYYRKLLEKGGGPIMSDWRDFLLEEGRADGKIEIMAKAVHTKELSLDTAAKLAEVSKDVISNAISALFGSSDGKVGPSVKTLSFAD